MHGMEKGSLKRSDEATYIATHLSMRKPKPLLPDPPAASGPSRPCCHELSRLAMQLPSMFMFLRRLRRLRLVTLPAKLSPVSRTP